MTSPVLSLTDAIWCRTRLSPQHSHTHPVIIPSQPCLQLRVIPSPPSPDPIPPFDPRILARLNSFHLRTHHTLDPSFIIH